MKKKLSISFSILILFLAAGYLLIHKTDSVKKMGFEDIKYVKIAGKDIKVDVALSDIEKSNGLSGKNSLPLDQGLLFIFEHPGKYRFWMKDMKFPIDIIWISAEMQVVYIKKDALPEKFPETYGPSTNAKYVLEVNTGFAEENKLKEGDSIEFVY